MGRAYFVDCATEIFQQQYVAIYVAKSMVPCDLLGPVKDVIDPLRTVFVSLDVGFVAKAILSTGFSGTLIVAE